MVDLPKNLGNLPGREDFEYKQKEFMLGLYENFQATDRRWFYGLVISLVLAIPIAFGLSILFTNWFINSYQPPAVTAELYDPDDLTVRQQGLIAVDDERYSAYFQLVNPNPDLSAWDIRYRLVFFDDNGEKIEEVLRAGYILAGQSKFFVEPLIKSVIKPNSFSVEFDSIRWTNRQPEFDIDLTVSGQGSGLTEEGNFFAEATIKNQQSYRVRTVVVNVLVFDQNLQSLSAVNRTEFTDLEALEARYFRVLWPTQPESIGRIEVVPEINPLDPELILDTEATIPVR